MPTKICVAAKKVSARQPPGLQLPAETILALWATTLRPLRGLAGGWRAAG
jgi:hypothetical protein